VVSQDADLLAQARAMGAASLLQQSDGLNEGLTETRDSVCAERRPCSCCRGSARRKRRGDRSAGRGGRRDGRADPRPAVVVLVSTDTGRARMPCSWHRFDAIPFRFGEGSRAAHAAEAAAAGAAYVELGGPLSFDVDTPEDLLEAYRTGLDHEAGR